MSLPRRPRRLEFLHVRTHPNDEALRPRVVVCSFHDVALRTLDTACAFLVASLPAVLALLPLAALASFLLAAVFGFMRFRLLTRIRTRVRAVAMLALVASSRIVLLYAATRNLNPASAVVASAAAAPLVLAKGTASPFLALAALVVVTCDGRDKERRRAPFVKFAQHAHRAYRQVRGQGRNNEHLHLMVMDTNNTTNDDTDDEAKAEKPATWDKPGTATVPDGNIAKMPAPALIDRTQPESDAENGQHGKRNMNASDVFQNEQQGNNDSGHLTRHPLAVVSEKDDIESDSLPSVHNDDIANTVRRLDVSDEKLGSDDDDEESHIGLNSASVALMVVSALLGDGAFGMMRALVVDIGDCALVVMTISAISFVLLLPLAIFDETGVLWSLFADNIPNPVENAILRTAAVGLGLLFLPVYMIRAAETSKSNTLSLCSSPRVACTTGAGGSSDAILRVTIARLQTTGRVSLPLALVTCLMAMVFHAFSCMFFGYKADNVSGLTAIAGGMVIAACWLQKKGGAALQSSAPFFVGLKRVLGFVRNGGMTTMHAAKLFITQSQSNRASWQVLNFFLFQAGMVLLESLYALTTQTTGLILVSADNIFCCVGLALGLYTIRRTARRVPGDTARRLESVAGFANGVLLVYVAVLVVLEAVERQMERGNVEYAHTFTVCVVGSLGNIAGLVFFPPESRRENHNVQGIYLHIWGNTLAFVGVAICTVLGERAPDTLWIGVAGALVVAAVIIACAVPLLRASAKVLTEQRTRILHEVTCSLKSLASVGDVDPVRVWTLAGGEMVAGVRIYASGNADTLIRAATEQIAASGYKRARTVVEVLPVELHRRTRSSTRILVGATHRRAHSCSRVDMIALEEA